MKNKKIKEFVKKIHPIYELLNWGWSTNIKGDLKIPTEKKLYDTIIYLLKELNKNNGKSTSISTGGLFVERDFEDGVEYGIIYGFSIKEFIEKE